MYRIKMAEDTVKIKFFFIPICGEYSSNVLRWDVSKQFKDVVSIYYLVQQKYARCCNITNMLIDGVAFLLAVGFHVKPKQDYNNKPNQNNINNKQWKNGGTK